ncbi:hypothetical protein [Cellulomonas hominis]|uniref:hypothetical protein n=1 Tax=Cellulomonas hominis TaxID=156981 RepID=UPI001BCCEA7A|nr:hypothetical protein [Cellulomonas hominis]
MTVTPLPVRRQDSSPNRDAVGLIDLLGTVAAGTPDGPDPDAVPWGDVAHQLASIEDVEVLRRLLAHVTARVAAADGDAS